MAIKKRIKFNIYPGNKTEASATLHQGNNWDDANPVNVTIKFERTCFDIFFFGCVIAAQLNVKNKFSI